MALLTKETYDLLTGDLMKTASKEEVFAAIMKDPGVAKEVEFDDDDDTLAALLKDPQIKSILQERGFLGEQQTEALSFANRLSDGHRVTESTGSQAKSVASRLLR
jgi:hypothetical protein